MPENAHASQSADFEQRLRATETDISAIKAKLENVATMENIHRTRAWVLGGALIAVASTITIVLAIVRLWVTN